MIRNPAQWSEQPELLDYDFNGRDTFSLYWARWLAEEETMDSAYTDNSSELVTPENSQINLSSRVATPDPRARGRPSPALTEMQRRLWDDSSTDTMATVIPASMETLLTADTALITLDEGEERTDQPMEEEDGDDFDKELNQANLDDSSSQSFTRKVEHLLTAMSRSTSPGPSGVAGEQIQPKILGSDQKPARERPPTASPVVSPQSRLSPDAEPFVPCSNKRFNTTMATSLHDRESNQFDLSDTTINEGDDGLTGLNRLDMDIDLDMSGTLGGPLRPAAIRVRGALPSSPPPPRGGPKRCRTKSGAP